MNERSTLKVNAHGNLEIGGLDVTEIVKRYPTPVYVVDERHIRYMLRAFRSALVQNYDGYGNVSYASKAFSCKAMYGILEGEGAYSDVVSIGEIMTAIQSGFNPENLYFHGNNKANYEITAAIEQGVGYFCVDSLEEIDLVAAAAMNKGIVQKVLVRLNPVIDADTHKFIKTATVDSKFGFSLSKDSIKNELSAAEMAINKILSMKNLCFKGINCHIGSQIFDKKYFELAVDIMTDFIKTLSLKGIETDILDIGGGFGIYYTDNDPKLKPADYAEFVKSITTRLIENIKAKDIKKPFLLIEPGRSIIGEAGITLYKIGAIKEILGMRKYIAVDGGMADNPRPTLYDARYEAVIANKMFEPKSEVVSIVGRCCERDTLIDEANMPKAEVGDIVAVFSTGAYNYSMSSNYNRLPRPGVLLVREGTAEYIVKPETVADMHRNDVTPDDLKC